MDDLNINWHRSIQVTMLDIYYKIWLSIIKVPVKRNFVKYFLDCIVKIT